MYCQGAADNKSTFFLVSAGLASSTNIFYFSLYGIGQEKNLVLRELRVELLSVVQSPWFLGTLSALFPNWYVAGRHNSSLWTRDLRGWCSSLLIVVLWRAQSAAFCWEPTVLLKLQSSLTWIILLIRLLLDGRLVPCTQEQIDRSSSKDEMKNPNNTQRRLVHRSGKCRTSVEGAGSLPFGNMCFPDNSAEAQTWWNQLVAYLSEKSSSNPMSYASEFDTPMPSLQERKQNLCPSTVKNTDLI